MLPQLVQEKSFLILLIYSNCYRLQSSNKNNFKQTNTTINQTRELFLENTEIHGISSRTGQIILWTSKD
jgi:hypothetical protein